MYRFFEISISFAMVMAIVTLYITLLVLFTERFIVQDLLENRSQIITIGSIAGATAITIASSIKSIAYSMLYIGDKIEKLRVESKDDDTTPKDEPEYEIRD